MKNIDIIKPIFCITDNNKKIIDIDKYSIIDLEGCNNIDKWVKNNYLEGSDSNSTVRTPDKSIEKIPIIDLPSTA